MPLLSAIEQEAAIPPEAREMFALLGQQIDEIDARIKDVDAKLNAAHKASEVSQRLVTIPGVGPVIALTLAVEIDPAMFESGRHLAAWAGLTPKERSTGGKQRMGGISRAGNERLRVLLVSGATSVINAAMRPGSQQMTEWLRALLQRKPRKARRRRARQQNGPHRLGDDEERRDVSAPVRRGRGGGGMTAFRHVTPWSGTMPRPSVSEAPMTGAERQARYRAAHAAGAPVVRTRRPADRRSRIQRWNDTVAAAVELQAEYAAWLDALPDNQQDMRSPRPCGRLSNSISPNSRRSSRHGASDVIEQRDGPCGMGHDDARGGAGVCRSSP